MRYERLDILRGCAIVGMVLFHLNYSLVHIFDSEILNFSESFWYVLGKFSALSFILIAGFSYFLAEQKYHHEVQKRYFKYALTLAFFAICISLGTYIFLPSEFIAFGILHFFALSFLLLPIFARLRGYTLLVAGAIIVYGLFFISPLEVNFLFPLGYMYPGFYSADYYPLFPYFGVLLLGYSFAYFTEKYGYIKILLYKKNPNTYFESFFITAGKNSLLIYLLHQPIIVGIIFVLKYLGIFGK